MKKIVIIAVILVFMVMAVSCFPDKPRNDVVYPKKMVLDTMTPTVPDWLQNYVYFTIATDKATGEKLMYWTLTKEGASLDGVKAALRGEATQIIAEGIKKLVTSQFSQAMSGDVNKMDQWIQSAVAFVAKNVKVSGHLLIGEFWEKYVWKKSATDNPDPVKDALFKVYQRWSMPYDVFVKERNDAWSTAVSQMTPEQQKLAQTATDNLKKLDEQAEMMDWGVTGQ